MVVAHASSFFIKDLGQLATKVVRSILEKLLDWDIKGFKPTIHHLVCKSHYNFCNLCAQKLDIISFIKN